MTMTELKIVRLPNIEETEASAVAATLRTLARKIETGELPNVTGGILILETAEGKVDAYGIGSVVDVVRGVGLLQVATFTLTRGYDAEIRGRSK